MTDRMFWIRIAPNGCVHGSALGSAMGRLAEDAHKEFTPKIADRRREAREGWTHELVDGSTWDTRAKPCLTGECDHRDFPEVPSEQD